MATYEDYRDIFPEAPIVPRSDVIDMHRKYDKHYIFYKKHRTYADCYCTCCMERHKLYYDMPMINPWEHEEYDFIAELRHNNTAICPFCKEDVTVKAQGRKRARLWQESCVSMIYPADNGNTVYIISGYIYGGFGEPSDTVEVLEKHYGGPEWYPRYVIKLECGSAQMLSRYYNCEWYMRNSKLEFKEPVYSHSAFWYHYSDRFEIHNPQALEDTFLKYVRPFMQRFSKPLKFLQFAAVYPTIEILCKMDGTEFVKSFIDRDERYKRQLNLKGKTPAEIFRTDGNSAARIKQLISSGRITLDVLKCFRIVQKMGGNVDDAVDLWGTSPRQDYKKSLEIIGKTGLTLRKFVNYMDRQAEKKRACPSAIAQTYFDYIRECEQLGYDIKASMINRPKDINAAHQRTMSAVRAIEAEKEAAQYRRKDSKYRKGLYAEYVKRYEYIGADFSIIVPKSALEIIEEGKAMDHCVAGYAERHIEGKLCILFLRRTDEPDKSLYTIEMHGEKLWQIQGYHNRTPLTQEARDFFDGWLKWQSLPEERKHPKKKKKSA